MSVRSKDLTTDEDDGSSPSVVCGLLLAARDVFAGVGVSSLSSGDVHSAMKDLSSLRSAVHAFEGALRNRARALQPPPEPSPLPNPEPNPTGGEPQPPPEPDHGPVADVSPGTLDEISGVTTRTGQARDRMARVLQHMPAIAQALADGKIVEAHVEQLATAMFSATDQVWAGLIAEQADLASAAGRKQPLAFGRFVSATLQRIAAHLEAPIQRDLEAEIRGSMWIDSSTGMGKIIGTFSPMAYQRIESHIRARSHQLMNNHPGMDKKQAVGHAILQLLTEDRAETSGDSSAVGSSIAVLIDERTLFAGSHSGTICEQPDGSHVPVDVAREMACNSKLTPILHDGFGIALDVGRDKRYNTRAQRAAIMSMYTTCFHSSCDVPISDCHGHHITYWDDGGRTDMANLLPVCQQHHRWIHANNPTITLDDQRAATVVMANGSTTIHHPNRRPHNEEPDGGEHGAQLSGHSGPCPSPMPRPPQSGPQAPTAENKRAQSGIRTHDLRITSALLYP